MSADSPSRVLVVEDQDDVRLMLVTVLQMEGYRVEEAGNAIDGLRSIKNRRYDLVLTDYAMPGGTGTWMLQEAAKAGRLEGVPALVVTAHPELIRPDPAKFTIVSKPIDLDRFLEQVRRILQMTEGHTRTAPPRRSALAKVELVLYVSAASTASMHAQRNMDRVLASFDRAEVAYTVCDLQKHPESAEHDRVAFTPTLVKRHPEPRMWVIGDLRDGEVVADLLRLSGVTAVDDAS